MRKDYKINFKDNILECIDNIELALVHYFENTCILVNNSIEMGYIQDRYTTLLKDIIDCITSNFAEERKSNFVNNIQENTDNM